MADDYKNIKVKPEVFKRLKRGKDDGQSWGHYLDSLREQAQEWESRRSDLL